MTDEEHKLMVFMFAQQFQRLMALVEALKAKGLLEPDDINAYEQLIYAQEDVAPRLFGGIAKQYEEYAEALGLQARIGGAGKGKNRKRPESTGQ